LIDHRIENAGALHDLENGRGQLRIVHRLIGLPAEDSWILRGGFHLDEDGRLILARLKISDDGGGDEDEKESEQNKGPADADYTPVIQKMNFNFVSCDHIRE
jgi:hypothetical protein